MAGADIRLKEIHGHLNRMSNLNLKAGALELLKILGYSSDKTLELSSNSPTTFLENFQRERKLNKEKALFSNWKTVDFLFQLTEDELRQHTRQKQLNFHLKEQIEYEEYQSYLFIAIELIPMFYSRADYAAITREINKLFLIPVMVIFKAGEFLTFSTIDRRLNKQDFDKNVLEKVTLLKDISLKTPRRIQLEILNDLSFYEVQSKYKVKNFLELHYAWQAILSTSSLNKGFYDRIIKWFNYAIKTIKIPNQKSGSDQYKTFSIRLISRLIFIWFLKELKVIDKDLLLPEISKNKPNTLITPQTRGSAYYHFVLQNLFFNALNKEQKDRLNKLNNFVLYDKHFERPDKINELILKCPFLNGGLFYESKDDCAYHSELIVPDELFLGPNGLNKIFSDYKFTIAENTPLEEEIAIDPEMPGLIFENLLAELSPDTQEAARKNAGAFYTPQPIISYICKNVLLRHLKVEITPDNAEIIVQTILKTTVLDPACGSGSFLMGILEEMMQILEIIDPDGKIFYEEMKKSADQSFINYIADFYTDKQIRYIKKLGLLKNCLYGVDLLEYAVEITKLRCWLSLIVEQKVAFDKPNYNLKPLPNLDFKFCKKNSLFRTFKGENINLLIDSFDHEGLIEELSELENQYFIGSNKKNNLKNKIHQKIETLLNGLIESQQNKIKKEMLSKQQIITESTKDDADRSRHDKIYKRIEKLNEELNKLNEFKDVLPDYLIERIVFPEIFHKNIQDAGFDIVISNPPYVNTKLINQMKLTERLKEEYGFCDDLYNHFTFRGFELTKKDGYLCYITSNTFLTIQTKENMRKLLLGLKAQNNIEEANDEQTFLAGIPSYQRDLFKKSHSVQMEFKSIKTGVKLADNLDLPNMKNFTCSLQEIINTPKAFNSMVNTAIFICNKAIPRKDHKLTYIDLRSPVAATFNLTEEEWQAIQKNSHFASWKNILQKAMLEIQIPLGTNKPIESNWEVTHQCNGFDISRDTKTKIEKYQLPLQIYQDSLNYAIFAPSLWNCQVFNKIIKPVLPIYRKWWNKINSSKKIEENRKLLNEYYQSLEPGDITILGLITDGGQGLATGDNGRFVGALKGTKIANNIHNSRPQKLKIAIEKNSKIRFDLPIFKDCINRQDYQRRLEELSELEIRNIFDEIKNKYGLRVFGKGYLYRIIHPDEIKDVDLMTDDEKKNGIDSQEEVFVPYDKGDKDGNRWYMETSYYINWTKLTVKFLKNSDSARFQNQQFYFKEGFSWSDIHTILVKSRIKGNSIHDVKSMSLFSQINEKMASTKYLIEIMNSFLISNLTHEFINSTSTLQINDARMIPIKMPSQVQHEILISNFNDCLNIKKKFFKKQISKNQMEALLQPIELEIENIILQLYGLNK